MTETASRPRATARAAPGPVAAVHVVAGLDPAHGGPSYSVPRLAAAQAGLGAGVTLLSVAGRGERAAEERRDGYALSLARWDAAGVPVLGRLRLSGGLGRALAACPAADVVHGHGLWLMPNVAAAQAARAAARPLVLSPRGMLAPEALAFWRTRKRLFWRLLQEPALEGLGCVHVTSAQEAEEVRAFGLTAPIAVIPNGVDLPPPAPPPPVPGGRREVLYLGRLHPKKSPEALIEAWSRLPAGQRAGWRLRIVGPGDDAFRVALARQAAALGPEEVSIEAGVFGPDRTDAYRRAALFVLPSLNENFGLTVAEALAAGTPVIATHGTPWSGLEAERCGWWVPHGPEPLAAALETAMALPAGELAAMGGRGREWVARDFSWQAVAEQMLEVYRWLRDGGAAPPALIG
ncbi:MAG TPA: glycosyltransferase [Paracoccaceae bacterium]|nr:glycosyltransferase [Paracoccaceae bacterium]